MYVILFVLRLFLQKKKKNSKRRFLIIPASKKIEKKDCSEKSILEILDTVKVNKCVKRSSSTFESYQCLQCDFPRLRALLSS